MSSCMFIFIPIPGEMIQFDVRIFFEPNGLGKNHQRNFGIQEAPGSETGGCLHGLLGGDGNNQVDGRCSNIIQYPQILIYHNDI